ncbi:MAG: diguanylate cyclase [Pseudanabaena frigida]|uniref:Diguanylate cyclase n=1 Tax=Pseudanabaena frigida TaxID=945775 RepID=A0A2W4YB24_9CYAN|nr:MAG: diguanylate cyclase [Pseudanabaena frigida]
MKKWTSLGIYLLTVTLVGLIGLGSYLGLFAIPELRAYDSLKQISPKEERDRRIVIVLIGEADLNYMGEWPMTDLNMARLIRNLKAQQPAVIGIDIYRNLPIEPGHTELIEIFGNTSNLIGIAKIGDKPVPPPPFLESKGRIGASDFVLDLDGKIRRNLMFLGDWQSLGTKLATTYLEQKGIILKPDDTDSNKLHLGKSTFVPLTGNEGEYNANQTDGYQILLNYRGEESDFEKISLTNVLENRIPPNLLRDRIVLVGTTAPSLNDNHQSPYKSSLMSGVVVHANSTSQIISAALDGRSLLQATSKPLNYLWIFLWGIVGAKSGASFIRNWRLSIFLVLLGLILIGVIAYYAFQLGWWIPTFTAMMALLSVAIATTIWELGRYLRLSYKRLEEYARDLEQKVSDRTIELQQANLELSRLAHLDGLTQIPNRRSFDDRLTKEWQRHLREQQPLSLILIDIDYFKRYNDFYGHQGGDECLIRVAQAIASVQQRPSDLVARYGGEEFVVILPNTYSDGALTFANAIQKSVANLAIPHEKSEVSEYVTLSLGIACLVPTSQTSADNLIAYADQSLYAAKEQGRNRAIALSPR